MANFRKLPIKNLSIDINGSYVETTNNNKTDRLYRSTNGLANEVYGVYKPYEVYFKNLNIGFIFNYHLPKAGLVISLRTQHFFIEDKTMQEINQLYAYIDKDLNKKLLTEAQIKDNTYLPHIRNGNAGETTYDLDKVYHNLNLKISKDFLNGFKFSFYANNFLDLKQTETVLVNGSYIKNIKTDLLTLSFGAKIEYEF